MARRRAAPTSLLATLLFSLLASLPAVTHSAPPPPVWGVKPLTSAEFDQARQTLPAQLRPALDLQRLLLIIRAGAKLEDWKPAMAKFQNASSTDPVGTALADVAKIWLARASITQIDGALRKYYRKEVKFPDSLGAVKQDIPAEAQEDPWGQPWIYKPAAPHGLGKLSAQRYQLGPTRFPNLSPLAEAIHSPLTAPAVKFTMRDVAGAKAIELRMPDGKTAILQAGGRAGELALLHIGDGWLLMADTERLFTVSF